MENLIILDIETGSFDVESGIFEVSALAIECGKIVDTIHLAIVEDEDIISEGYGAGYEEISSNNKIIEEFKTFIKKYNYPIVAHNANFDRKFLVYYKWIDEDYVFYDSIRAIKYENSRLFSYALDYLLKYYELDKKQSHTALGDTEDLYELIKIVNPKRWIPIGQRINKSYSGSKISNEELKEQLKVENELFKDRNMVFTGKGPYKRDYLKQIAIKCGANILDNVTKKADYVFYDSIRAIKYENSRLFSYALDYLLKYYELDKKQSHTALGDTEDLYELIKIVNPKRWIPIGQRINKSYSGSKISNEELKEQLKVENELFKDRNMVFTGKGPYKRDYLKQIAIKCGANILDNVTKKADILVVGEDAGKKLNKANELGIEILSIDDFMDMTQSIHIENNQATNVLKSINDNTKIENENTNKLFDGLTISLIPMRVKMSEKVGKIIESFGGNVLYTFRKKETNILIYEDYGSDFITVKRAKECGIKTIPLHEFNRIIISKEKIIF